jgi:MFS transporter, ACDE family, multidrug resistance protein
VDHSPESSGPLEHTRPPTEPVAPEPVPHGKIGVAELLRDRSFRAVVFGTFVIMLGYGILSPILPLYARSFGVGYGAVGLLNSAFAFTRLLFDLVSGPVIRRFGERAMVTVGACVVGVSSLLASMAPNFPALVVLRGAGGAGSSLFFVALMSYLLRTAPSDRVGRVMGVFYGAFNVGMIVGNPVGGFVGHFLGLASPLVFYGAACLLAAVVFLRAVERSPRLGDAPGASLRDITWSREFVAVLVANLAYFFMVAGVFQTLLSLFQRERLGLSLAAIGGFQTVVAVAEFAVLFPAGSAIDRRGRRAVLLPATVAMVIVVAALGFATTVPLFAVVLVALGIVSGYGGVPQPVMLSDVVPEENRPAAIGVYRFVGDLGFVIGPLVAGGAASAFGFQAAFALTVVPSLLSIGLLLTVPETLRRRPAASRKDGLSPDG